MIIKSKLCNDCGFYVRPKLEDASFFGKKNEWFVYFKCDHCENERVKKYLAQLPVNRAKKVIQKSDTKVNK